MILLFISSLICTHNLDFLIDLLPSIPLKLCTMPVLGIFTHLTTFLPEVFFLFKVQLNLPIAVKEDRREKCLLKCYGQQHL